MPEIDIRFQRIPKTSFKRFQNEIYSVFDVIIWSCHLISNSQPIPLKSNRLLSLEEEKKRRETKRNGKKPKIGRWIRIRHSISIDVLRTYRCVKVAKEKFRTSCGFLCIVIEYLFNVPSLKSIFYPRSYWFSLRMLHTNDSFIGFSFPRFSLSLLPNP